jgi:hypothetical protein
MTGSQEDGLVEDGEGNVKTPTNKVELNTSNIRKIVTRNVGNTQRRKVR